MVIGSSTSTVDGALTAEEIPVDELSTEGTSVIDGTPSNIGSSSREYPSQEHRPPAIPVEELLTEEPPVADGMSPDMGSLPRRYPS